MDHPRTLVLRKSVGRFVAEPQDIYDRLSSLLSGTQVGIEELFWLVDESLYRGCFYAPVCLVPKEPHTVPKILLKYVVATLPAGSILFVGLQ